MESTIKANKALEVAITNVIQGIDIGKIDQLIDKASKSGRFSIFIDAADYLGDSEYHNILDIRSNIIRYYRFHGYNANPYGVKFSIQISWDNI